MSAITGRCERDKRELAVEDRASGLFADVRHQRHEASAFDGNADRTLERRTSAAPLAAKEFALGGAKFLQAGNVLVIDEGGSGTAFLRAEPTFARILPLQLLPDHERNSLATTDQLDTAGFCQRVTVVVR